MDIKWLVLALVGALLIEGVAAAIIAMKMKNRKASYRAYVSLLPALLLGAVAVKKDVVIICAVLGALVVAAAIVIAVLLAYKNRAKKAQQTKESSAPSEKPAEAQPAEEPSVETAIAKEPTEEATAEDIAAEETTANDAVETPAEEDPAIETVDETDDGGQSAMEDLSGFEETGEASGRAFDRRRNVFVSVRYDRSYTSRLIQSDDKTKSYYDEIKSELMAYKGVKNRISWRHENFRIGRERVAKLQFRGKKLCLYLPLDPAEYADSKYKIEDFSDVVKNKEVPLAYLIKNDLRARYAKELIAVVMERFETEKTAEGVTEYSAEYPYDTLNNLIDRQLIKVLMTEDEIEEAASDIAETQVKNTESKKAETAPIKQEEIVHEVKVETAKKLLTDERASHLIEESVRYADRTRTGYVNVDVLSRNFNAGEYVDLKAMKERIAGFDQRMTFVKVLARGILDKPLTVEGDDFSLDAAKMILLTGGKVIRTKRK